MHERYEEELKERVCTAVKGAAIRLEPALNNALKKMKESYEELIGQCERDDERRGSLSSSLTMLQMILSNLEIAEEKKRPMCQDTGMLIAFVSIGPDLPVGLHKVKEIITEGAKQAFVDGSFRYSIVDDPLYSRTNTASNLPVLIHYDLVEEGRGEVSFILKGFGSENCSAMKMFNPTSGDEEIIRFIVDAVRVAGGKPCPPIVLGVGIGASAEGSALLAKKALLREVGTPHPDPRYADLEKRILEAVQGSGVGPGGFGGPLTALGVSIECAPTHIAGLPVSLAISCWADRKGHVPF